MFVTLDFNMPLNSLSTYYLSKLSAIMETEYAFACPHCWQTITMLLDLSVSRQSYVEDCEVCCRPILIAYESDGEAVTAFDAQGTN